MEAAGPGPHLRWEGPLKPSVLAFTEGQTPPLGGLRALSLTIFLGRINLPYSWHFSLLSTLSPAGFQARIMA